MLMWHRQLQLIDHGAALYFHHSWNQYLDRAGDPFTRVKDHILLPFAAGLEESDARLSKLITLTMLETIVGLIPESWLDRDRKAYVDYLHLRLQQPHAFVQEAIRARSQLV